MVKYLNLHKSSFALKYFLNGNGEATMWHTPLVKSLMENGECGTKICAACLFVINKQIPRCWIAEATGCLASFLVWASVDYECQENQGCCVWSTQVYVSGFLVWGQSYRAIKLFQVSRCWATWHKRYASCNTTISNVREKGSFCIATQMCKVAHLWPSITMPTVWYTSQTSA